MISLSVCMIVKDEEEILRRCLTCVKQIADEIIIVDTGSADNTKEIAKEFTNKIYDFKWCNDFSKARNYSFSKATKDYIMWIDADDVILEEDIKKINKLKLDLNNNKIDMVMLKYEMFDKNSNRIVLSYYRERIFKREKNYKWISPIHEVIVPSGNYIFEDIAITHKKNKSDNSRRNITIFEDMLKKGTKLDARQKFYYARELLYVKDYTKSLNFYYDFLNTPDAWVENKISACIDISKIHFHLNNQIEALKYLFKTFEYDIPRAEVCCEIGEYFKQKEMYNIAIYWYKQALTKKKNLISGGFYINDCYSLIPHINLCICYDRLKNYKKAKLYNELANKDNPINNFYLTNKIYFDSIENKMNNTQTNRE